MLLSLLTPSHGRAGLATLEVAVGDQGVASANLTYWAVANRPFPSDSVAIGGSSVEVDVLGWGGGGRGGGWGVGAVVASVIDGGDGSIRNSTVLSVESVCIPAILFNQKSCF